jgi:hypothetical protein
MSKIHRILFLNLLAGLFILSTAGCNDSLKPDPVDIPIQPSVLPLSEEWKFTADPTNKGEREYWYGEDYDCSSWLNVELPHTWNVMEEFYDYIGTAWYRYEFIPEVTASNTHQVLKFGAVYYEAAVWLNGEYLGEHEGGYTPFEFDVSGLLEPGKNNVIAVRVDNYRLPFRIPDDSFDWWPYGGIHREVSLETTNQVFIDQQYVVAEPKITGWNQADSAEISTRITISNTSPKDFNGTLRIEILDEKSKQVISGSATEKPITIQSGSSDEVEMVVSLESPSLWHFDDPNLYIWKSTLVDSKRQTYHQKSEIFGIRKIELLKGQFLLNGEPVRLVGMTRHVDSKEFGLAEPVSFMAADYDDMKRLNVVLSRPVHYPQAESVLDYCDRNGILLSPEIPAWQIQETHLKNKDALASARQQLTEMILSSYNHPSIWAWSVGNEIDSNTSAGKNYVSELVSLAHDLDPSMPVGFASYRLSNNQENDATALTDFVFMNQYMGSWHGPKEGLPLALDRIHALWPDKVVIISEFGLEAGWTSASWLGNPSNFKSDSYYFIEPGTSPNSKEVYDLRSQLIDDQMDIFRRRPYVAGAIFWTYRDYRSDLNFSMGLLDINGNPTPVIDTLREQYSPIREISVDLIEEGKISVELLTRGPIEQDMPVYTLRGYSLAWEIVSTGDGLVLSHGQIDLPDLAPADSWAGEIEFGIPMDEYAIALKVLRPTGFAVWEQKLSRQGEVIQ